MSDFNEILNALKKFRDDRDWAQFHNPKDLALALNVEAGELLEIFLWKNAEDGDKSKVKEELADILSFAFLLADKYNIDIKEAILGKIELNQLKYPIDKAKGTPTKYTDL